LSGENVLARLTGRGPQQIIQSSCVDLFRVSTSLFQPPKVWMPTDQVRGLKAHGTRPAKTKLGARCSPLRRCDIFPGQPRAKARTRGFQSLAPGFPLSRTNLLTASSAGATVNCGRAVIDTLA